MQVSPERLRSLCKSVQRAGGHWSGQFIKDELAAAILCQHGGIFTDIDIIATRLPLPLSKDGSLFALEPQSKVIRNYMPVSLAIMRLPAGCDLAVNLKSRFAMRNDELAKCNCKTPAGQKMIEKLDDTNNPDAHTPRRK